MLLQSNALTTATVTLASIAATVLASVDLTAAALTKAVTFDGSKGTTFQWRDLNDPVMGGRSFSTFHVDPGHFGVFNGTCAIVPSLKAPGFAKITTDGGQEFADLSEHIEGYMELSVRSTTPGFKGYKIAFAAKNVPRTSIFGGGSFKAGFNLTDAASANDFQIVKVPSKNSHMIGRLHRAMRHRDPTGQQHHCSDADNGKYCPIASHLCHHDIEVRLVLKETFTLR